MKDTGEKENDAGRAISDDIGDIMEEAEIASTEASREQSRANSADPSMKGDYEEPVFRPPLNVQKLTKELESIQRGTNTQKSLPPQSYNESTDQVLLDPYDEDQNLAMSVQNLTVRQAQQQSPPPQDPTPEEANKIGGRGRGRGRGRVNF